MDHAGMKRASELQHGGQAGPPTSLGGSSQSSTPMGLMQPPLQQQLPGTPMMQAVPHTGYATGGGRPSLSSSSPAVSTSPAAGAVSPSSLPYGHSVSFSDSSSPIGPPPLKRERSCDFATSQPGPTLQQQQQQQISNLASQTSLFDVKSQDVLREQLVPTSSAPSFFLHSYEGEKEELLVLRYQKENLLRALGERKVKEEKQKSVIEQLRKENRQKDILVQACGKFWNNIDNVFDTLLSNYGASEDQALLKAAVETYKSDLAEKLLGSPFSFSTSETDDAKKVDELVAQRFDKTKKVLTLLMNMIIVNRTIYSKAAEEIRAAAATDGNGANGKTPQQRVECDNANLHSELERLHKLLDEKDCKMRSYASQYSEMEDLLRSLQKEQEALSKENEELKEKARKATTQMCRKLARDALLPSSSPQFLNPVVSPPVSSPALSPPPSGSFTISSPAPAGPSTMAPKKLMRLQEQQSSSQQSPQLGSFGVTPATLQVDANIPDFSKITFFDRQLKEANEEVKRLMEENKQLIEKNKHLTNSYHEVVGKLSADKEDKRLSKQKEIDETNARMDKLRKESEVKWQCLEAELRDMKDKSEFLARLMSCDQIFTAGTVADIATPTTTDSDEILKLKAEIRNLQGQLTKLESDKQRLLTKVSSRCPVTVKANNIPVDSALLRSSSSSMPATDVGQDDQNAMMDEEEEEVFTKDLRDVITEEVEKLQQSSGNIETSLKNVLSHLSGEKPASEDGMMDELGALGDTCEQLQTQNTALSQQLTTQYDQRSKLSRDKMAMELRLNEVEGDLKQAKQDLDEAKVKLERQLLAKSQMEMQVVDRCQEIDAWKQREAVLLKQIEQESRSRENAENELDELQQKVIEAQKQRDEKDVQLSRCMTEKDNLEKEIKRQVMGLVWVYKYKLKWALSMLPSSSTGSSAPSTPSKSRFKKGVPATPQSRLTIPPEYKDLLPPDDETDKFEVPGRALLGSSADVDGTMVEEDLGSLYRQMVKCSVCGERDRSCVLKRCSHTFCDQCISKCVQNRNRKCPKCHAPFSETDIVRFIL